MGGEFVEIVIDEAPLRRAMLQLLGQHPAGVAAHLRHHRDAGLSRAALLFVRPLRRITANMMAFRDAAGEPREHHRALRRATTRSAPPSASSPPCSAISPRMLQQKSRLAALGLAVSKINHDLRNLLTSAQLFSDRLASLPDPRVQRFAPKLMRALERAIAFCRSRRCPTAAPRSRRPTAA